MSQGIDILTPRRQQILGIVVRRYVEAATPVSSKAVSSYPGLDVSSATVRNEMAYLEEHGYLTHPHTSAGRIPTEKGYRYFVEQLMVDVPLLLDERRMIEHQFHQAQLDLNQWMRLAATVMAHASSAAAIVAPPHLHRCRFKHLELISTHGPLVLLVLVLEEGLVKQQVLSMDRPRGQEDLSRVSRWLNDVFAGLEADDICQQFSALPAFEVEVGRVVVELMEWVDHNSGPVYRDGLVNVLSQPEFVQNAGRVARVLSEGGPLDLLLWDMVSMAAERGSVQVVIGGEGQRSELADFGLVLSHYGINGYATGALGVLGPVRMPYARAVSVVRFMSQLLSELIQQLYGDQIPPSGQIEDRSLPQEGSTGRL